MKRPLLALLLLSGCGRQFSTDCDVTYPVPDEWKTPYDCNEICPFENSWWTCFNDCYLNHLEEQAITFNRDLFIACERIQEAKALACIAFSNRLPHLYLSPSYQKAGQLIETANYTPFASDIRTFPESWSAPFALTYEVDFWGKYQHADQAAKARYLGTRWGYWNVYNTLTSDVATLYLTLRTLDEEIRYLEESVKVRQDAVDVNYARTKAGLDPEIDLSRAQLELARAEQELEDSTRLRALAENGLAILVGQVASCFSVDKGELPDQIPTFSAPLPCTLLLQRPDIWETTQELKARLEEVGVAYAEFFPSFDIGANIGYLSPQFGKWISWMARYWSMAIDANQTLFDGGRLVGNWRARVARYNMAVGLYQRQVEMAFEEVENAFVEIEFRKKQFEAQDRAAFAASDTAHLAHEQFNAGLINYLQVADAEKTELDTERLAIRLKGSRYLAAVQLVKALGGKIMESGLQACDQSDCTAH